jgi:hypothetical protein
VVLRERGVRPVHCYFEREGDDIWLSAAHGSAATRVNYQPLVGRMKLGRRSIVEVGEARLQVVVIEDDEDSPLHGPFGTEMIGLRVPLAVDLFETARVDASVALGELPTTAWTKAELVDARDSVRLEADRPPDSVEELGRTPPSAQEPITEELYARVRATSMSTALTTTERIPRTAQPDVQLVEPVEPVRPSLCILIETKNRVVSLPATPLSKSEDDTVPAVRPRLRALGAFPVPASPVEPRRAVAAAPTLPTAAEPTACPAPITDSEIVDIFTTMAQPIAETFVAPTPVAQQARQQRAPSPLGQFTALRQRFAMRFGREPRVVGMVAVAAALSLTALTSQAVRGWREIVEFSFSNAGPAQVQAAAPHAGRNVPPPVVVAARSTSASASDATIQSSVGDPLVDEAAKHLVSGRQADAVGAYASLAVRYPSEPVYAAIANILRRRLKPACKQGNETECGRTLP